ncbi:unnamed protein product [Mytilus coruscus]|uniref:Reverse transcriptase RNase H-like domain-containing protein n=1 Tax=Mytilus coruscus TaxID=42192 RepID=A0A6J8CPJ8_MYTCO|nr:unnamed protein product [Mytilus coruscus]
MTPLPEDHASFGHPMQDTSKLKTITMSMVADTGYQSSIIPLQFANNLGITEKDLLPVKLVMRGAIKEDLCVIGAVAVSITTNDSAINAMSTRFLCYVSDTMERAFICREAPISLGIIHTNFSNVTTIITPNTAACMENSEEVFCSCSRRQPSSPPVPTILPPCLKATEEHVESLKGWLLDYYGTTTFNVCEHQSLPLMNCEPLQLHVDPNAKPVAVHKPALVTIHWHDKVYVDLERDVRIGVLEQVCQNLAPGWWTYNHPNKHTTKFLDAISNFPTPTDITGARAWFGLINQGAYAFAMARQLKPFRALLKPSTTFCWTNELDEVFHKYKEIIIQEMKEGVRLFDSARMTCLTTDWSVDGIGFFLMQKYCQCSSKTPILCNDGWKLCLVGSRFTHSSESRYAPIEGEALAVVYALHETRYYVRGCKDLLVANDHKPLLKILNARSLTDIANRRLLKLKEKTLGYRFTITHVPGRNNLGPVAASRYPVGPPYRQKLPDEAPELDLLVNMTVHYHDTLTILCLHTEDNNTANYTSTVAATTSALNAVITVVTWDMVREATASDPTFVNLIIQLEAGFP